MLIILDKDDDEAGDDEAGEDEADEDEAGAIIFLDKIERKYFSWIIRIMVRKIAVLSIVNWVRWTL